MSHPTTPRANKYHTLKWKYSTLYQSFITRPIQNPKKAENPTEIMKTQKKNTWQKKNGEIFSEQKSLESFWKLDF